MFHTDVILWLQSWASPALTTVMNAVSLFGYTRAYVAIAALLALTWRLRPAAALIVLLALNAVLTDSAKTMAAMPRPDTLDNAVHALGIITPRPGTGHGGADVDDYGFPSGHVSATVAFVTGLIVIFQWKRAWIGFVVWLPLMALSRVYLGRHFLGDLAGGAIVGLIASTVGLGVLKIGELDREWTSATPRAAMLVLLTAAAFSILSMAASVPDSADSGRFFGAAIAAAVVSRTEIDVDALAPVTRALLVLLAAASFAVAWGAGSLLLQWAGWTGVPAARLVAAACQMMVVLLVPVLAVRRMGHRIYR